jgi:aromatic ring-cleaving dioxygenase
MEGGTVIAEYHAHIYYRDTTERAAAERVRATVEAQFTVRMGRWRDEPVGPHPAPMFQVAFAAEVFPNIVPWLMLHREGLVVLVHPETGRPRDDHLKHSAWMGAVLTLNGAVLPEEG